MKEYKEHYKRGLACNITDRRIQLQHGSIVNSRDIPVTEEQLQHNGFAEEEKSFFCDKVMTMTVDHLLYTCFNN
jgi:hypothetical protein